MSDSFELKIYTPDGVLFSDSAKRISAINSLGQFGILPGHTLFASDIVSGDLEVINNDGNTISFEVGDGLISVENNNVTVALERGIKL